LVGDEKAVSNSEFEKKFLQHEIAFFGRRISEFREMGRIKRLQNFSSQADQRALLLYEQAAVLHDRVKRMDRSDSDILKSLRSELSGLMTEAENQLSLDEYLPTHERQPYIQYQDYWRALTGLLIPRYGHNSGALGTTELKNFITFKRNAETSVLPRVKWNFLEILHRTQIGRPELWKIQQDLADDYEKTQGASETFKFSTRNDISGSVYLRKLSDLAKSIDFQVEKVLIPQFLENRELSAQEKESLFKTLREFSLSISSLVSSMDLNYRDIYLNSNPSSGRVAQLRDRESRLNIYVERALSIVWDLVKLHQAQAKAKKMSSKLEALTKLMEQNADLESKVSASLSEDMRQIFPNRHFRWQAIAELSKNLLGRSEPSMLDMINRSVRPFRFMRQNQQASAKFVGWKPEITKEKAHYVLNLSHDQGLLEVHMAYQTFEALGVEKVFVLTTKKAWGKFPKGKIPGEEVVYIEDEKPLDELVKRILESTDKKVGILFCPEGLLPSMFASPPVTAKPGAFVFARKMAAALPPTQKLYMINGTFNAHDHFTSVKPADLELTLYNPILVPRTQFQKADPWVRHQRFHFENLANAGRLRDAIDFIRPRLASQTDFPVCGPLRSYVPIAEWFGGDIFTDCARRLRALGKLKIE